MVTVTFIYKASTISWKTLHFCSISIPKQSYFADEPWHHLDITIVQFRRLISAYSHIRRSINENYRLHLYVQVVWTALEADSSRHWHRWHHSIYSVSKILYHIFFINTFSFKPFFYLTVCWTHGASFFGFVFEIIWETETLDVGSVVASDAVSYPVFLLLFYEIRDWECTSYF